MKNNNGKLEPTDDDNDSENEDKKLEKENKPLVNYDLSEEKQEKDMFSYKNMEKVHNSNIEWKIFEGKKKKNEFDEIDEAELTLVELDVEKLRKTINENKKKQNYSKKGGKKIENKATMSIAEKTSIQIRQTIELTTTNENVRNKAMSPMNTDRNPNNDKNKSQIKGVVNFGANLPNNLGQTDENNVQFPSIQIPNTKKENTNQTAKNESSKKTKKMNDQSIEIEKIDKIVLIKENQDPKKGRNDNFLDGLFSNIILLTFY